MTAHDMLILHWVWAVFFLGFGIFLVTRGRYIGSVRMALCRLRMAPAQDAGAWEQRIRAAAAKRQEAEGEPAPIGMWMGAVSLILSPVAGFTPIPVGLLYAIFCFAIAFVSVAVFLRLRNSQRTRVALLSVRKPDQVISPYWFVLAVCSALSLLVYFRFPQWTVSSTLVCVSSLITTHLAWRMTRLGVILTGEDIVAERFVDDRVRLYRNSMTLMFAFAQPFVFVTETLDIAGIARLACYMVTWLACLAFIVWVFRWQMRRVQPA